MPALRSAIAALPASPLLPAVLCAGAETLSAHFNAAASPAVTLKSTTDRSPPDAAPTPIVVHTAQGSGFRLIDPDTPATVHSHSVSPNTVYLCPAVCLQSASGDTEAEAAPRVSLEHPMNSHVEAEVRAASYLVFTLTKHNASQTPKSAEPRVDAVLTRCAVKSGNADAAETSSIRVSLLPHAHLAVSSTGCLYLISSSPSETSVQVYDTDLHPVASKTEEGRMVACAASEWGLVSVMRLQRSLTLRVLRLDNVAGSDKQELSVDTRYVADLGRVRGLYRVAIESFGVALLFNSQLTVTTISRSGLTIRRFDYLPSALSASNTQQMIPASMTFLGQHYVAITSRSAKQEIVHIMDTLYGCVHSSVTLSSPSDENDSLDVDSSQIQVTSSYLHHPTALLVTSITPTSPTSFKTQTSILPLRMSAPTLLACLGRKPRPCTVATTASVSGIKEFQALITALKSHDSSATDSKDDKSNGSTKDKSKKKDAKKEKKKDSEIVSLIEVATAAVARVSLHDIDTDKLVACILAYDRKHTEFRKSAINMLFSILRKFKTQLTITARSDLANCALDLNASIASESEESNEDADLWRLTTLNDLAAFSLSIEQWRRLVACALNVHSSNAESSDVDAGSAVRGIFGQLMKLGVDGARDVISALGVFQVEIMIKWISQSVQATIPSLSDTNETADSLAIDLLTPILDSHLPSILLNAALHEDMTHIGSIIAKRVKTLHGADEVKSVLEAMRQERERVAESQKKRGERNGGWRRKRMLSMLTDGVGRGRVEIIEF